MTNVESKFSNKSVAKKIFWTSVGVEAIIIGAGLTLAAAQGADALEAHGSWKLAVSAAAFPLLLAGLEIFKIPAGIALHKMRWALKPVPLFMMAAGMFATAETVTMAGLQTANVVQYEVNAAKAELDRMKAGEFDPNAESATEDLRAELEEINRNIDSLSGETSAGKTLQLRLQQINDDLDAAMAERENVRQEAMDQWEKTRLRNVERMRSDIESERTEGERAQAGMPRAEGYAQEAVDAWERENGAENATLIDALRRQRDDVLSQIESDQRQVAASNKDALDVLYARRAELQNQINEETVAKSEARAQQRVLKAEIAAQQLEVTKLAGASLFYQAAAKYYDTAIADVSEEQVNKVTKYMIGALALATAALTSLGGFVSSVMGTTPENKRDRSFWRKLNARRKWKRKETVEVPVEVEIEKEVEKIVEVEIPTLKYTYIPVPVGEDVQDAVKAILEALPDDAAAELRGQLAQSTNITPVKEVRYENAA